jgi:hypothetical protein
MSIGAGGLKILRCLQKQQDQCLSTQDVLRYTRLSSADFHEAKHIAIRENYIRETNAFVYLENKGKELLHELDSALMEFMAVVDESKLKKDGDLKTCEVVYRHGKFYDKENGTRLIIKEGATLGIEIYKTNLLEIDPYNMPLQKVASEKLLKAIEKKNFHSFKKIADKSDFLSFTIKAGKRTDKGGCAIQCDFSVTLLSDLYLFKKTPETVYGLVFDCSCVVDSTTGSLENFEPIYAFSLNDAYTKTYDWYFGFFGKSTTNVYNNFWLIKNNEKKLLSKIRIY